MAVLTINTTEQFERWLDDHAGFADARVLSLSPLPRSDSSTLPSKASIELAYQIAGDYKAHSTRVSRLVRIQAAGIAEYSIPAEGSISSEHWSEGIEVLDSECPIAFEIDVPAPLTLCCTEISVEELPNLTEIVPPWLSGREVFAKIPAASMPTPSEWQTRFNGLDQDVVWHIYRCAAEETNAVPSSSYEGWFLQTRKDLNEDQQGIFFFACKQDDDGFQLQLQNQGASNSLWQAAMTTLAAFDGVAIHCGNCEFSGGDFLREWKNWNQAESARDRD